MVDVLTEILIHQPRESVWEYASNPDNAPKWYVNIKSVEWKTEKPLQEGSQIAFTAHFMGRKISYTYEFVELVPGEKLVMRTAQGPFPMETTYTLVSIDLNSTRMTLCNRGIPSGFSKWMAPLMSIMMRRVNYKDLKKLKQILEDQP